MLVQLPALRLPWAPVEALLWDTALPSGMESLWDMELLSDARLAWALFQFLNELHLCLETRGKTVASLRREESSGSEPNRL